MSKERLPTLEEWLFLRPFAEGRAGPQESYDALMECAERIGRGELVVVEANLLAEAVEVIKDMQRHSALCCEHGNGGIETCANTDRAEAFLAKIKGAEGKATTEGSLRTDGVALNTEAS